MSTTVTSSTAMLAASKTTKENSSLGSLDMLPREVRDKIYQYIFSGFYKAMYPSTWMLLDIHDRRILIKLKESGRDLTMLQLSKAINHEAAEVFYSEGVFLCSLVFHSNIVCLPQASIDRMMKIELDVYVGLDTVNEAWETVIQKLNVTNFLRKSIHVKFQGCISVILNEVPSKVSDDLRSLTRYRTVIVEFSIIKYHKAGLSGSQVNNTGRDDEGLWSLADDFMGDMESALGPATLSHTRVPVGVPGYTYNASCFRFHPSQHKLTFPDAEVKKQN